MAAAEVTPQDPQYWQVHSPEDTENFAQRKAVASIPPPDAAMGLATRLPNPSGNQPLADTDNPPLQPMPGGARPNIDNAPVRPPYKLGDTTNPVTSDIVTAPLQTASTRPVATTNPVDPKYWKVTPPKPPQSTPQDQGYWKITPPASAADPVTLNQRRGGPVTENLAPGNQYVAAPNQPTPEQRLGEMVPQAAVPALQAIQTHVNEPIQKFVDKNVKGAGEIAERAAATAVTKFPTPQRYPGRFATPPQELTPEQLKTAETEHPYVTGIAKAAGEAAGGLTDPRYLPFFFSGGEVEPILKEIISLGFKGQMAKGAVDAATNLHDNWDKMTPEQRVEAATQGGISAYLAVHGGAKLRDAFSGDPAIRERHALVNEARTIVNSAGMEMPYNPTADDLKGSFRQFQARAATAPEAEQQAMKDKANRLQDIYGKLNKTGEAALGEKPVHHVSNDVKQLRESAERQSEKIGDTVAAATEGVPGAKVEAVRDAKDADRIEDKAARQGVQPSQIADIAGAKVSVPDQKAADQVLANLHQEMPVESANGTVTGEPGKNGVRQTQAIVNTGAPAGESVKKAEIMLQTPEMTKATEASHDQYRKAQELRAAGDEAGAVAIEQKIAKEHEAAEQDARERQGANAVQEPGASRMDGAPQETVGEAKRGRIGMGTGDQGKEAATPGTQAASEKGVEPTFKHRSTQANIPTDSEAGKSLETARGRISDSDLAGKGKDVGGNHVTVRYGLKADSDVEGVKRYLATLRPFEAQLGKTEIFPASESSDGAAVVHAPIESPELTKINSEIQKHGEFAESNFKDYKPHATVAYVNPDKANRYKGMNVTEGKTFPVTEIAVTDREGKQEMVKLEGKQPSEYGPPKTDFLAQGGVQPEQMGHPPAAEDLGVKTRPEVERRLGSVPRSPERRASGTDTQAGVARHGDAMAQARERLGLKPGEFHKDLLKTADEIERSMRGKAPIPPARAEGKNLKEQAVEVRDANGEWKQGKVLADNTTNGSNGEKLRRLRGVFDDGSKFDNVKPENVREVSSGRTTERPAGAAPIPREGVSRTDMARTEAGKAESPKAASLGVDFDGTLFKENPDGTIGAPIPERIASLKQDIADGKNVVIESHRAGHPGGVEQIHKALESEGLPRLPVTPKKNVAPELIDDKAQKVAGVTEEKVKTDANTPLPEVSKAPKPLAVGPERGSVGRMRTSQIVTAPHRFQYKLGTDSSGTSSLLKETKVYDPQLAGTISVWRDPTDGKWYVINGHHRFELAKRTGQSHVNVMHIEAKDAAEARAIGARQNISEGRGTPIDAAKFFRETGITAEDLDKYGISLGEATASNGLALSKLSDPLFNKVVQGDLPQGQAIAIGEGTSDHAEQAAILKQIERKERSGGKVTADRIREFIRLAKGSEQRTETTTDLFGSQEVARSLAWEKSEISEYIKQQLAKDKRLFGFVSKGERATELERGGNKIDVEKSKEISTGAAQAAEVYEKLSTKGGPISAILDASARRLADGENAATAKADAYKQVRSEVSKTLGGTQGQVPEGLEKGAGENPSLYEGLITGRSPEADNAVAHAAKFELVKPGGKVPDHVILNPSAMQLVSAAHGGGFLGVNMGSVAAEQLADNLERIAEHQAFQYDAESQTQIKKLAELLRDATDENKGLNIIKKGQNPLSVLHTIGEETFHSGVQRAPGGGLLEEGVPTKEMLLDPGIRAMGERLDTQTGNARNKGLVVVAEGMADIFLGDAEELSPEQAQATAEKYFGILHDKFGIEPIETAQAIYDYLDKMAAEQGLVEPGEQYEPFGTAPARNVIAAILEKRSGTKASQSSRQWEREGSRETGIQNADTGSDTSKRDTAATGESLQSTAPVGLTDEELADWSKSRGFRVEPAGEQAAMFGEAEPVVRVFRIGPKGKEQKGLAYQSQLDKLSAPKSEEPLEPFALTGGPAPAEEQPRLFGAGDMGEIIGNPNAKPWIQAKDDYSLFRGEEGSFRPAALNPSHIRQVYDKSIKEFIDSKLKIGDKYYDVAKLDETVANTLHLVDNGPRYFKAKASTNVAKVTEGLTEDQIRLASLMVDSDSRDYIQTNKPEEYQQAKDDPKVMAAVDKFKTLQEELTKDRQALGWPVRKSLTLEENKDAAQGENRWLVKDRDGNPVADFKSEGQAMQYVDENATVEPHLKRTYPEHSKNPLPGETGAGENVGSFPHDKGLRPPKMDKKSREMSAQYHYEHGRKDFSGYIESFKQAKTAVLKQQLFDEFTSKAEKWTAGTAQPSKIEYNGKTYYRPDIVAKAKEGKKDLPAYGIYDPTRGERFLVFNPSEGWAQQVTGKPGIKATDRFLGPKQVVDAMENYDTTRGGESGKLRHFFQEQIVGLFGPMVHINNIVRHIGHATGLGAFDPRSWPSIAKVIASPELRERVMKGVDDATIDMLAKYGAYTDWGDIGTMNQYIGGNLNPLSWIRTFGKGVLFDPKFGKGWGGLDPKARIVVADYFKDHYPEMTEAEIGKAVEDGFGNYNRANWTERQRLAAKFTLFPGWDAASVKWFLRHPFKVGVAGALVVLAINQALKASGKNKGDESTDLSYIHIGDRKFKSGLVMDAMGDHIMSPVLGALQAKLRGDDVGAGVEEGGMRGSSALAGTLAGPVVEMVADQVYNRKYAGGGAELVKPEDRYTPGTWAPNVALEKRIAFAALKGSPALNRFIDTKGHWDWVQGIGGAMLGVTNFKFGAEERFRANLSKSYVFAQTMDGLAEREPEAAEKFASDPQKAVYLMFHADLQSMGRDLKEIDAQIDRVRTSDLSAKERQSALEDLKDGRNDLLKAADALGDALDEARDEARGKK